MKELYVNSEEDSNYDEQQEERSYQTSFVQSNTEFSPEAENAFEKLKYLIEVKPDSRLKIDTKTKTSSEILEMCYKYKLISKDKYELLRKKENKKYLYQNHPKLSRKLIRKYPNMFYLSNGKSKQYFQNERDALDKIYKIDYLNQYIQNGGKIIQIPDQPQQKNQNSQIYFSSDDGTIIRTKLSESHIQKFRNKKVTENSKVQERKCIARKTKPTPINKLEFHDEYKDQEESSIIYKIIK